MANLVAMNQKVGYTRILEDSLNQKFKFHICFLNLMCRA